MTTLKDVHWFSYRDQINQLKSLTLWQAIVYVLLGTKGLDDEDYWPYIEALNHLEEESADEILDHSVDTSSDPTIQINLVDTDSVQRCLLSRGDSDDIVYDNISLPTQTLRDDLALLDSNRIYVTEHFPIPNVLYTILSAEVDRALMGLPAQIQLQKKRVLDRWPLIRRTSLDAWQNAYSLSALRLQQAGKAITQKKPPADLTERLSLTIGILARLLLQGDDAIRRRIRHGHLNVGALAQLVFDRAEKDNIECPSVRTLTDYINNGEKACIHQTRSSPP